MLMIIITKGKEIKALEQTCETYGPREICITLCTLITISSYFHPTLKLFGQFGSYVLKYLIGNMTRALHDPQCIKTLYCALVRRLLEYACIVWWPSSTQAIACATFPIPAAELRPAPIFLTAMHNECNITALEHYSDVCNSIYFCSIKKILSQMVCIA